MIINDFLQKYRRVAYCLAHKGYLTKNLRKLHRCTQRKCMHFRPLNGEL